MTRLRLLAVAAVLAVSSAGCESRCTYYRCAEEPAVTWPRLELRERNR